MRPVAWLGAGLAVALAALFSGCLGEPPTDEEPVVIDVVTSRYAFTPGSDAAINVTEGQVVVLRLTSTDVTHGFAITEYGINVEVPPGEVVEVKFRASRAGDFLIYCTVFCGVGHPEHKGTLHVA